MPLYTLSLTVPPNTPEGRPVSAELSVMDDQLITISLWFPPGCMNSTHVRLKCNGQQIAPIPSGWISDDNARVEWREVIHLPGGGNYYLQLEGWSEAEDWPHTVTARFIIE